MSILGSPAWGWLFIVTLLVVTATPYDLWLKLTHRHTLTRQMHDWLFSPSVGPFIGATVAFLLVLGLLHFLRYHSAGP